MQPAHQVPVDLHRDHARAGIQQVRGERSPSRADFDDRDARSGTGTGSHPAQNPGIGEKVLPKPFAARRSGTRVVRFARHNQVRTMTQV